MEMDKIVNLDHEELALQLHQSAEQIFRLRFQLKMGQSEGLKKLRELKKDIARIKTVERQRELGIPTHAHVNVNASATETAPPKRKARKTAKKSVAARGTKSKKAAKKTSTRKTKRPAKVAGKTKSASKTKVKAAKRGKANAKKGGS